MHLPSYGLVFISSICRCRQLWLSIGWQESMLASDWSITDVIGQQNALGAPTQPKRLFNGPNPSINYIIFHWKSLILAASGMETAKRNMMEQLRQKYLWKYGFSDMAKLGDASGQIGGWRSGGPSAIMCDENFHQIGTNWFSTHIRFQIYPILPAPKLFWPWKWASKLKSHFLKASFSQPTFKSKWVGEPD